MYTTQKHLAVADIYNDILLLKDGGGALVLQVDAVNFGLLSYREQMAIITSFAQMLNSLSFSIQIVIQSQRLNINSYLTLLDKAQRAQTNPLLSNMISEYKQFIQNAIKENDVLDKKFYLVIPLFSIELGITASKQALGQKIKTVLLPRRDQIIRQLSRVGLRATQLTKQQLVEVFYSIYNGEILSKPETQTINPEELMVRLKNPQASQPTTQPISQSARQQVSNPNQPANIPVAPVTGQSSKTHPFVVEELEG